MGRLFLAIGFCSLVLGRCACADTVNVSLYYNASDLIYRANADGTGRALVVGPSESGWRISEWTIDEVNQRIYCAESPSVGIGNTRILSTAMDGTDRRTIYSGSDLGQINYGMAVDGAQGYVFLHSHDTAPVGSGPYYDGGIQRITISSGSFSLLPQNVWYARLDVDASASRLYYSDVTGFASGGPSIFNLNGLKYSAYDGSGIGSVSISGQTPTSEIAVAGEIGKVFFQAFAGDIYSASLTGGTASFVASTAGSAWMDFDAGNSLLYWLDADGIHRSAADGSSASLLVDSSLLGGSFSGLQVVAVPEPSTWAMGAGGLVCVAWRAFWRRRSV
jgi:hypothetical protein